jgi:Zn-dependent protease with chaperone function
VNTTARWFDGETPTPHTVTLSLVGRYLTAISNDGRSFQWPCAEIVRVAALPGGGATIMPVHGSPERLVIEASGADATLAKLCPNYHRLTRFSSRDRLTVVRGMALIAAVLVTVLFGVPLAAPLIARAVPASVDAWLGARVEGSALTQLTGGAPRYCQNAPGSAALADLNRRLSAAANLDAPVSVSVVNHSLVNAVALPGNRVVVFSGLLNTLTDGDQLAGVIAHELGHLARRDPMARVIAMMIWSTVIDGLMGIGASGIVLPFLNAAHSREVETATDRAGVAILARAGIASEGFARAMEQLARQDRAGPFAFGLLDTHPPSLERAAAIRAIGHTGRAAMTDQQWSAIRSLCR